MKEQQVVIVGAGPSGLITALGLAQQGVEITIVERAPVLQDSPRAIVYHWSTLDGLERLGLFSAATQQGFLKQDYEYRIHKTQEKIKYGLQALEGKVKHPYNLHLGQGALAQVILEEVEKLPNVRILWEHEFESASQRDDGVSIFLKSPNNNVRLETDWLIGADGAGSAVRKDADLEFEGMTWPERFVAANVRFPDQRKDWSQSTFYVDDQYGAIIAKINESGKTGLWRYTYMEDASLPLDSLEERLPHYLDTVFGAEVSQAIELEAISPYRMHQRSAPTYRLNRTLLVGDAAHATNPCGGLGLTMGLFDAYALIEALGAVLTSNIDDSILDEFSASRREAFVEKASPRASSNKQLIFHSSDMKKLNADLELFRRISTDRELAAEVLYFTKTLETPRLVRL